MHIKVSDQKIRNILDLVNSIPLPSVGSTPRTPADKVHLQQSASLAAQVTCLKVWQCLGIQLVVVVNVNHVCWSPVDLLERGDGMVDGNHLLTSPIQVQLLAHERRDHLGLGPVFLGAMETG